MEDKIEDGMGQHRIELEERGVLAADGGVHLRGGGEAGKVGGVSKKKEKENSRKKQAEILAKKIKNLGKRLQSQEFLDTASKVDVKNLEEKIARRVNMLRKLDSKNGLEVSDVVEPSQASRADDSKSEDEDQAVAHGQSKKRKVSKSGFDNENEEGINEIADPSEAIVIDDTSRKIEKEKKEKKHKKHKKLKVDKSSQNSSQPLNSIPAFEEPEPEHSVKTDNANSKKTASRDRHTDQDISQNGATTPSPEKARQAALLDTITRSRTRSESAGDGIYEALVAGMLAQPSPPSPMSSIADYPRSLIDIGRSAIAAPTLPSSQKPIRDRAFKAQVPVPAPKVGLPTSHKESPIPPPVRNFSSTRIVPATRENGVEKTKSKKKDAGAKEYSPRQIHSPVQRRSSHRPKPQSLQLPASRTASTHQHQTVRQRSRNRSRSRSPVGNVVSKERWKIGRRRRAVSELELIRKARQMTARWRRVCTLIPSQTLFFNPYLTDAQISHFPPPTSKPDLSASASAAPNSRSSASSQARSKNSRFRLKRMPSRSVPLPKDVSRSRLG
ncbi:hypothetical protein DL98DRAFT_291076 [Cadophora sp. DSE1049]|nr:hypothetical protein DL98DRAFT_291076 [Cadophora sp. DSE1049]